MQLFRWRISILHKRNILPDNHDQQTNFFVHADCAELPISCRKGGGVDSSELPEPPGMDLVVMNVTIIGSILALLIYHHRNLHMLYTNDPKHHDALHGIIMVKVQPKSTDQTFEPIILSRETSYQVLFTVLNVICVLLFS